MAGEQRAIHPLAETDAAMRSVPALPLARAARATADMEILENHGEAEFEDLGIGQARVGHVGVHARRAVPARPGRRTGADRLVILILVVAEGEVVHGALRASHRAERTEEAVRDRLRHLDVTRDHRRRILRRQHRPLGDDDADGPEATRVHRDHVLHHHAEDVEHRRAGDRLGCIEIVRALRRGAGEIHRGLALFTIDRDLHADAAALIHLVVEAGVMQLRQHAGDAFGCVVLHVAHVGLHDREREVLDHLLEFGDALGVGGDLCLEVVDVLDDVAHRIFRAGEQLHQFRLAELALIDELEVVDIDALLLDVHRER